MEVHVKTRIVYPNLWESDPFLELSKDGKILALYLCTSSSLGLTRYVRIGDRKILNETGLNRAELEKAKEDITHCGIYYFEGWFFNGSEFAYLDYEGRDRVLEAKAKELSAIPADILRGLEGVIKGLKTGYQPVLNTKSEIINPKPEGVKRTGSISALTDQDCVEIATEYGVTPAEVRTVREELQLYCAGNGKVYKNYYAVLKAWTLKKRDAGKMKRVSPLPTVSEIYRPWEETVVLASDSTREEARKNIELLRTKIIL